METLRDRFDLSLFTLGEKTVTLSDLAWVVVVFIIAWYLSLLIRKGINRIGGHWPSMNRGSLYALARVSHYVILLLALVIALSTIGVNMTNVALVLGALGIGIGFGLQNIVANFVSGLIILFERPIKVGDFVEFQSGVAGEIREIRMRAVRITTNDNVDVLVPNVEFTGGRVVNWTLDDQTRRIHVPFGVAYGSDKDKVREVVVAAAEAVAHTQKGVPGHEPQVWLTSLGESSLDFSLVVWVNPAGLRRPGKVRAEYLWVIHDALLEAGIRIPFPQRDIHVQTMPESS